MFSYIVGTFLISMIISMFVLTLGFVMGFDRHMRDHHNRSITWKDLW